MFLYLFFSVEDFSIKNYILKKFIFSEKLLNSYELVARSEELIKILNIFLSL